MKKTILFLMILLSSTSVLADSLITLSGSAVTGFGAIDQKAGDQTARMQFESAANVNVGIDYSNEFNAEVNVGVGSTQNQLGFQQGVTYLGFALNYAPEKLAHTTFTAGSITIPFGQFAENQSDNANFSSSFILNDIGYALLTKNQPLGDFGGNGVRSTTTTQFATIDAMVFNGTGGNDTNPDKGFGVAVRAVNSNLLKNTSIGVSYFNSNDSGNNNAINANASGAMVDASSELYGINFGGYYGIIGLNDSDSSTKDGATILMGYIEETLFDIDFALRYSVVQPGDYNGDGTGISSGFDTGLGLSDIAISDVDVSRLQVSGTVNLNQSVSLVNEIVVDTYGENRDDYNNTAALSYASIKF